MTVTAQTDQQKAGVGLTKEKFTTVGGVDVYMFRVGSIYFGMGPGTPNNDLVLDAVTPYGKGSIFLDYTNHIFYVKTDTDSSMWVAVTTAGEA